MRVRTARRIFIVALAGCFLQLWRVPELQRQPSTEPNRVIHVGQFGLGHRLSKLSAAVHLADQFGVPILQVQWTDCHQDDFFRTLFGESIIPIQPLSKMPRFGKKILVRNDVHGYYAGQAYKNFLIPVDKSTKERWNDKLESDRKFFEYLRANFVFMGALLEFQKQHEWGSHHVVGVHIRAGNGETGHFAAAERNLFMDRSAICQALQDYVRNYSGKKPLLVFVATDTVDWIDFLRQALTNIPVVSLPQERVEPGKGVSFSNWKDDARRCSDGWVASASDMFLLAASNTLIATTRSTFTQILPLSIVLSSSSGQFCELRTDGHLVCFRDLQAWLFDEASATLAHKVMVHLPDVEAVNSIFDDANRFLWDTNAQEGGEEKHYYYGRKYNQKYREKRQFQSRWVLVD